MPDYVRAAKLAKRLIAGSGREVDVVKLSLASDDPLKPWRGSTTPRGTPEDSVTVMATFVQLHSYTDLGVDLVIDKSDTRRNFQVALIAAYGITQDLRKFDEIIDGDTIWKIGKGQILKPGPTDIFYVLEVSQ